MQGFSLCVLWGTCELSEPAKKCEMLLQMISKRSFWKIHCKRLVLLRCWVPSHKLLSVLVLVIISGTGGAWWDVGLGMGLVVESAVSFLFRLLTWTRKVTFYFKNRCGDHLNHHRGLWVWLFALLNLSLTISFQIYGKYYYYLLFRDRIAPNNLQLIQFYCSLPLHGNLSSWIFSLSWNAN